MDSDDRRGLFLVVEGIDGAGKTTQVRMLGEALRNAGREVVVSHEPTDGPWGKKARQSARSGRMSLEDELHAFIEDRKQHLRELILPSLDAGKVVLLDRYFYSTIAYQGARGMEVSDLTERMKAFARVPDRVYLLDLSPTEALRRISQSRGEAPNLFEKEENLIAVRGIFQQLAQQEECMLVVDSSGGEAEIHTEIWRDLQTLRT